VFGHTSIIATFYPFNFLLSDSVKRVVQTATVPSLYSAKGKFFFLIGPVASLHRHPRSSTEHSTCCHKICGVILQKTSGASDVAQTSMLVSSTRPSRSLTNAECWSPAAYDGRQRSSREAVRFSSKSDLSILLDQEAVKYTQEATLMLSQGSGTCKTERQMSCSSSLDACQQRRSLESVHLKNQYTQSGLSVMLAQDVQGAVKCAQETTCISLSSLEMGQRCPSSTSSELPYSRVLFTDESDLSIMAQSVADTTSSLMSSPGWRSTALKDSMQRSSRKGVRFLDKSALSLLLDQEAVKYTQEDTLMRSQGSGTCKTKWRISRSTSLDGGQQSSVHLTCESGLLIMLAQDVQEAVKNTQETTRDSSSSLETKQRSPCSTSREAGWRTNQHGTSRAVPVADKSNLLILVQDVAKYTQETTRLSSPGEQHSSCSTSREAGRHCRAVLFADESDLPNMTQDVAR